MPNVNKAIVMGVLGRDPETKNFPNGGSITTFSVATSEHWKDKTTGERKEATEWHRIATSNRLAEIASKYLKKGGKVYIEGSLRTRKWKDQSGLDREVTEIKRYRLSDENGLSLLVTPAGQKYWNVRYTVHGERKSESVGPYPDMSLKKARELALELKYKHSKSILHEDIKPFFKEVAEDWFENQKETWSSKHISNVRASLDELYTVLSNKRINQIQAPEILQIIKKIEARGSLEVAKRTLSRCGMVMKYAIAHGYRYDNPASDLVYALKNKKVKNLASLPESEMPEFLRRIKAYPADAQTHHAIILIMLTGVRVSELLQARWEEFDLDERKWDIPAERMKNGLPHRVPITDMMIDELQALRLTHNQDLLFPHRLNNKEAMRSESILAVIKRSGYAGRMTTHGFRSLFSTVLNESNLFNPDAIERQLAHVPQNRIRAAYNRAQYWDERVKIMEWYEKQVRNWYF